jgi:hypothetical protein
VGGVFERQQSGPDDPGAEHAATEGRGPARGQDEVSKLEAARQRVRAEGLTPEASENLYLRAHDLKGLGATYEYPLVTRIAGSLCKLIDDPMKRSDAPLFLVDAHIDAIKAAVKGGIQTDTHPTGRALVQELEQQVKDFAAE